MVAVEVKYGRLFRKFSDQSFILDDESYFKLIHSSINGNGDYWYLHDKTYKNCY